MNLAAAGQSLDSSLPLILGGGKRVPYVSDAQRRFFHSKGARKAGISKKTVEEYDAASKGMDLPEHVDPRREVHVKYRADGWQGSSDEPPKHKAKRKN